MSGSLIDLNLGGLAKPVEVLIERISDAVGGIAKPWQIARVARAEGKAEIVKAQARIEVSELEQRAIIRVVHEEGKRQKNIESITAKSFESVREDARPDAIDPDWMTNFFNQCRNVSDDEMQQIWAKILAGEANRPGNFKSKTVNLLGALDKDDALAFQRLSKFTLKIGERLILAINKLGDQIYEDSKINFEYLTNLDELGLINFNSAVGFSVTAKISPVLIEYGDRAESLSLKEDLTLPLGAAIFTKAGSQLMAICEKSVDYAVLDHLKSKWSDVGINPIPTA